MLAPDALFCDFMFAATVRIRFLHVLPSFWEWKTAEVHGSWPWGFCRRATDAARSVRDESRNEDNPSVILHDSQLAGF